MDGAYHPYTENHPITWVDQEAYMVITNNVVRGERILRVILGVMLILFGFFLAGFWKPLSIVVGGLLVLTAIVGY